MAFAPNLVKEWYKDLSVEELEKKYKGLEENYYFESKEQQIKYILDNFMNASHNANLNSTRIGIEELLKEKTGKDYKLKEQEFHLTLIDIINYFVNCTDFVIDKTLLIAFFNSIDEYVDGEEFDDEEKQWFLLCLFQNKEYFSNFIKELTTNQNKKEIFEKYSELAEEYYSDNRRIG